MNRTLFGVGDGHLHILPDGSIRFKGKIKTEDGEERTVDRKVDVYLVVDNGEVKVRKVFGATSLSIKYAPKELVLAGILPIPNSLVEEAKEMSLKDSSIDGFIIGEMPDSKYRFSDSDKVFIAPARNIEIQEPEQLHEKEDLKAYETPTQMMKLAFNSVLSAGVKQRIELYKGVSLDSRFTTLKEMKNAGLLRSGLDVYRLSSLYSPEDLKEMVKQGKFPTVTADGRIEEVSVGDKALKAIQKFLEQYEKFYPALVSLREAERMIERGEPVGDVIRLLAEKVAPVYNLQEITPDQVYLPVVDYQAGSGRHIEALEEIGFKNTELFGVELRQLEPKDERNKVLYGIPFETAKNTLAKDPKVQKREIIYLNPPYTNDMKIQKESIDVLPPGVLMTGVFSTKVKNYLAKKLENGIIFIVPKELTGYQEENTPEGFIFVVGFKAENLAPANAPMILDISDKSPEEALNIIREFFAGNVNKLVTNPNDRFLLHQRWTAIADYVRNLMRKNSAPDARRIVNELWDSIYNGIRWLEEYRKQLIEGIQKNREKLQEVIYSTVSYLELAEKGERVFPDTRFFGEKPYYSINEVVKNLPLLSFYKANYPSLYNLAKTVAERIKIPFPDLPSENEKIYTTNENLGIMKLAVLPKSLPINKETVETLLEVMREEKFPEESIQTVKEMVETEEAERFLIKSTLTNRYSRGNLAFAYTSVLSIVSKFGDDLMAIPIPLKKFYDKLEEKKIINLKDRVEVIEPSENFKKELLDRFTEHLDAIRERLGITEGDILQDIAEENRIVKIKDPRERARKAVSFVSEKLLHYNLVEFLTQEIIRETPPELLIEDRLKLIGKARGISLPTNVIAQRLADTYLEAPKSFYEGKGRDEKVKEIIKEVLDDREIPYDASLLDDLTLSAVEGIADHYSLLDNVRNSAIKLYRTLLLNERLKRLKEKDSNKAWEVLENWFIRGLGVKRHQWNEAVRTLAKYEKTGEGGHLLGWEMRSGKTLVMLLTSYFGSLYLGKDSYLFPRVANLNDILYQAITFVPMLSFNIRAYRSGDTDPMYRENRTAELLSHNIFPNLFGIISSSRDKVLKDFVVGGGEKVRKLLETYAYEMERLTEIAREQLYTEGKSWNELMKDEKLHFIWEMDAYAPETRVALYYYIKRHSGDFNLTPLHLESLKDVLLRHNARVKIAKETENTLDKPPMFTFHVVPKSKIFAQNFFIEKSRKELYRDRVLTLSSDRDYEAVVEVTQVGDGTPFLNDDLPTAIAFGSREEVLSEIRESFVDYIYHIRDDVLEVITGDRYNLTDENREKLYQIAEAVRIEEVGSINNKSLWGIYVDTETLSKLAENNPFAKFFLEESGEIEKALERIRNSWKTREFLLNLLSRMADSPDNLSPLQNFLDTYELGIESREAVEIVLRGNFFKKIPVEARFDEELKQHVVKTVGIKYREIDPNNPLSDKEQEIPINGTVVFKFKSPRSKKPTTVEITVMGDESHRKPYISSKSNARQYYVYSSDVKGRAGVVIVDEVDEASDPSSLSYLAFKYLMENAEIRMGGTGTPTSGYPEMIVSLLGLTAELPYETVIESSSLMKENFSVWELRPELASTVIPLALITALNSAGTEAEKEEVVKLLSTAKTYTSPDEAFQVFWKGLEKMAKDRNDMYLKYILENALISIGQTKLASSLMNFLKSIEETSKKYGISISPKSLSLLAFQSVSRVAPRGAGTFDPIGYVSSLKVRGATLSLNTRENLKGQPEKLEFDDQTIKGYEFAMMDKSYVYEATPELFAPDSIDHRIFEDFTLARYLGETGLPQVLTYVLGNASVLKEAIVKNPKPFIEKYSKKLNENTEDLVSLIGEALDRDFGKPVSREKIKEAVEFLSKYLKEGEQIKVVRGELEDGSVIYNFVRERDYYGNKDIIDTMYALNATHPEFSEPGSISRTDLIFKGVEIPVVDKSVELPESVTPSKVKTLLSSRTKQANDDILSVIKTYLYNNCDWEKTQKELKLSDEKLLVAKAFWKELGSLLKENAPYLRGEKERPYKEEDGKKVALPVKVKTSAGYEVEAYLLTIVLSDNRVVVPLINDFGYLTDGARSFEWSTTIEFGRANWSSIMKSGELPKISYKFNYLNPSNFEIIDSYSNVGYYNRIRENAFQGVNFLLSSPRVLPEIFGIYDLLTALKEAKESGVNTKDVHVLIRASNKEVKEAIKKVDRDRLESLGIHIKTFNTNAALDAESKKIKKILNMEKRNGESKTQLIVCATDETIARGVDLSHLDEIVVLGANSSGKIASQLYARLFDADKKNWGRIYTVGEPLAIRVNYREMGKDIDEVDVYNAIEEGNGGVVCVPNGSFYKVSGLLDKERFIRQITSGKLINVANLKAGRDIVLTNEGKYALVKKETQERTRSRAV